MKQNRGRKKSYRRRSRLRASNWFPFALLTGAVLGVLTVIGLITFVGLPKLLPFLGVDYHAPFMPTPTPVPTPAPTPTPPPMQGFDPVDAQREVIFDGSNAFTWFGDPYFYKDKLLLAAGRLENNKALMTNLFFYERQNDKAADLGYTLQNQHFMFARFNDTWLVYLDAKYDGGGLIMAVEYNKPNAKPIIIKEVFAGQPELMLDDNYLAWTERTGSKVDKLFLCDLTSRETVTVQVFSSSPYGQSKPSLTGGLLLWADSDGAGESSVICYVQLGSSPTIKTYQPGTYVHDPKGNGMYLAWLDGNHGPDTSLYYAKNNGAPVRVASGVVDFGFGGRFVAYSKDSTIYVHMFDENKSYRITPERELAQFLGVSDNKVIWMDVTTRERDIVKYASIP